MSLGCRRHAEFSPNLRPIRQKLQFSNSDGEEDSIEEANSSTGAESGFTELDSPVLRRSSTEKRPAEINSSPLNRTREDEDPESWDEEGFGSPSHLKPSICMKNSPSPRKSPRAYDSSPERTYIHDDLEGSSSPIPDCPDTPPHKTFRKLRLFDTPHTPKVSDCDIGNLESDESIIFLVLGHLDVACIWHYLFCGCCTQHRRGNYSLIYPFNGTSEISCFSLILQVENVAVNCSILEICNNIWQLCNKFVFLFSL